MEAVEKLVGRIETTLNVTEGAEIDVRFTMTRDAAKAFVEMVRTAGLCVTELVAINGLNETLGRDLIRTAKERDRMRDALQMLSRAVRDEGLTNLADVIAGHACEQQAGSAPER